MSATLYGLGIGPGDPELITLKAARVLADAPVIVYPAPERGDSLARAIAARHIGTGKIEIAMRMPMVAARFPAQEVYDRTAAEIAGHLDAGRDVAALCEGDPFFYGSFMFLYERMAVGHRVEVVPGVSSLTACAAVLGAPLVARNDVLSVVPATLEQSELRARIESADACAIVKVGRHLEKVRAVLGSLDLLGCAHYVEHATMSSQKILPIESLAPDAAPYFSMVLLHKRGAAWQ